MWTKKINIQKKNEYTSSKHDKILVLFVAFSPCFIYLFIYIMLVRLKKKKNTLKTLILIIPKNFKFSLWSYIFSWQFCRDLFFCWGKNPHDLKIFRNISREREREKIRFGLTVRLKILGLFLEIKREKLVRWIYL